MHLHCIGPSGAYTSLSLDALEVWRLELATMRPEAGAGEAAQAPTAVAVVLTYLSSGAKARQVIAAVDVRVEGDAAGICAVGLPHGTLEKDRERLHEAAKSIYNNDTIPRKEVDEIVAQVARLVDVYYAVFDAVTGQAPAPGGVMGVVGPHVKGTLGGYRFAVTTARNEPWRLHTDTLRAAGESIEDHAARVGLQQPPPASAKAPLPDPNAPRGERPPSMSRERARAARRESQGKGTTPVPGEQSASSAASTTSDAPPAPDVSTQPATSEQREHAT